MKIFDRWAPRLLAALVFLTPLFFSTVIYDTYDLPKLTLVYLADLLLAALWIWQALSTGELAIKRTPLDMPIVAFLAVNGISAFHSIDPSLSFYGAFRIYVFGFWPMMSFAVLYFLTAQVDNPKMADHLRTAALISAACVGFYGLLQYAGLEVFSEIPAIKGGRVWSSLGNPVYVGALCMMAVPLALDRLTPSRLVCLALAAAGLLLSLSRSAWVGTWAGCLLAAFIYRERARQWGAAALAGLAVVIACIAFIPAARERVLLIGSHKEASNAARLEGWKAGVAVWRQYPVLGSGSDTFFEAFRPHRSPAYLKAAGSSVTQADAHNDLIQMASTEGILGLAAYLWILFTFLRRGLKTKPEEGLWAASLLALGVQNQFNFSSVTTCAWAAVFAGVLFGSVKKDLMSRRETAEPPNRFLPPALAGFLALGLWGVFIPVRADWHYKQGLSWTAANQPFLALAHFKEAVRLNGRVEIYESDLANAARSAGLFDDAWAASTDLVRRHPQNPDVWNNQGVSAMWLVQLAHQDKWSQARDSFEKAIVLDPVFVDAWANLAKWNHLRGNLDEEKRLWKKVLELNPDQAMARQVLGLP